MKQFFTAVLLGTVIGIGFAGSGGITGRVTDINTGVPVVNSLVVACADSAPVGRAQTDERGVYLIDNLEPGKYRIIARAPGYLPAHYPIPVLVEEGQVTQGIDLRLRKIPRHTGAISGRVFDRITRQPIPGAVVVVLAPDGNRRRARTDRNGFYIIRGLAAGRYQVGAKARHYFAERYPEPVEVRTGEVSENINFLLQPKPRRGGIIGQVVDARTGRPIPGVLVVARGEEGEGFARTDGHGFYRIGGLNPGEYQVAASKPGYEPAVYPSMVPVHPGEATRGIDFRLRPVRGEKRGDQGLSN